MRKNALLALLLLALMAGQAWAEKVENPYEHEWAGRWYLTVVLSGTNSEADQKLEYLLATSPRMQEMLRNVIYTRWDAQKSRWMKDTDWRFYLSRGQKPVVVLQEPARRDGTARIVAFLTADMGNFDETFVDALYTFASLHETTYKQCPRLTPPKRPAPSIEPDFPVTPLVPTNPVTIPEDSTYVPLWAYFLPLLGVGGGLLKAYKEDGM